MIVKEHTAAPTQNLFQRAGNEAERQMAHYLRRAFGESQDVRVFNNLSFEHAGEVAQIDHLIFHRAGFIVVESKSVTSAVGINERDEWVREWNGRKSGMPSPVLQARRQADFLRGFLQAHKTELRNKLLFGLKQGGFTGFIIDVAVAISDSGVIKYRGQLPEVKKADQIPEHVRQLIASHQRAASLLSAETRKDTPGFYLTPEEFDRVTAFLQAHHSERPTESQTGQQHQEQAAPSAREVTLPQPSPGDLQRQQATTDAMRPRGQSQGSRGQCSHCQSHDLEIRFGRSYYFKCRECGGNTAIKATCAACGTPARLRKSGPKFYTDCPNCSASNLYFVNP